MKKKMRMVRWVLLSGLALLSGYLLFWPTGTSQEKIVVVGAGLSGLTTAYRLQQQGHDVAVYEARTRPGGRIFTCLFEDGVWNELGGMNLDDAMSTEHITALVQEFGLTIQELSVPLKHAYVVSAKGVLQTYSDIVHAGPQPINSVRARYAERAKTVSTLHELLDEMFGSNTPVRELFEKMLRGFIGLSPRYLAAAEYFNVIWQLYALLYTGAAGAQKAHTIQGGMYQLINALCGKIPHVYYDMPLTRITRSGNRIQLDFNGELVRADRVVLTLPCTTLRDVEIEAGLISDDQMTMIKTLRYGTNAKILLPLKQKLPLAVCVGNQASTIVCQGSVLWCYYGGECGVFDDTSSHVMTGLFKKEQGIIRKAFPRAVFSPYVQPVEEGNLPYVQSSVPQGISWVVHPYSKGSYACVAHDQFAQYDARTQAFGEEIRAAFRPVDGKIFFAGEHTALDNPSTMEGAVESGERTARMVRASMQAAWW